MVDRPRNPTTWGDSYLGSLRLWLCTPIKRPSIPRWCRPSLVTSQRRPLPPPGERSNVASGSLSRSSWIGATGSKTSTPVTPGADRPHPSSRPHQPRPPQRVYHPRGHLSTGSRSHWAGITGTVVDHQPSVHRRQAHVEQPPQPGRPPAPDQQLRYVVAATGHPTSHPPDRQVRIVQGDEHQPDPIAGLLPLSDPATDGPSCQGRLQTERLPGRHRLSHPAEQHPTGSYLQPGSRMAFPDQARCDQVAVQEPQIRGGPARPHSSSCLPRSGRRGSAPRGQARHRSSRHPTRDVLASAAETGRRAALSEPPVARSCSHWSSTDRKKNGASGFSVGSPGHGVIG